MRWATSMTLLALSTFYLYRRYTMVGLPPAPPPPPPPAISQIIEPILKADQLRKVRSSALDPDGGIRLAALRLLFQTKDPEAIPLLEKMILGDPLPENRMAAIELLRDRGNRDSLRPLIKSLDDYDAEVRKKALQMLGSIGDPAAAPWVVELALKDYDPQVRAQALQTLGQFHERRRAEWDLLVSRLKTEYEQALERRRRRKEGEDLKQWQGKELEDGTRH